ncbi:MAG: MATE family efflux transporter [Cyanobacteria bacterium P01_A01_bin.135]
MSKPSPQRLLAEGRRCLQLALPLIGAQLAQAATGFVDTITMGRLGRDALGAGALGTVFFMELFVVGTSLVASISPFIAEAYGAGRLRRTGQWLDHGIWLAMAIACPISLLMWNAAPLLRALGQSDTVVTLGSQYLQAASIAYLPALLFIALRSFVSALLRPQIVLAITLGGVALNAAANEVLAFGRLGLPALGLAGIGWSTTCIYWSMALALLVYVMRHREFIPCRPLRSLHRPCWRDLWELLRIGIPVGILSTLETSLFLVMTIFAGQMGVVVIAAHQIALQTAAVTFMVPLGISQAATVRVGQCLGKSDWPTARLSGLLSLGLGGGFMGVMGLLMLLLPRPIVSIYLNLEDPANREVVALAGVMLAVGAVFQVADGLQVIAAGALRGLKDTRTPMLMGVVAYWLVGVPSGYTAGFHLGWGGVGLWWGLAVGLITSAAALTWRFHRLTLLPVLPDPQC